MKPLTDKDVIDSLSMVRRKIYTLPEAQRIHSLLQSMDLVGEIVQQVVEKKLLPSPPDKRMEDMTEPELSRHLNRQLKYIKGCQSEDTVGSMLIIFQKDNITQYGSTIDPETAPQALRELADRLEKRETVKRDTPADRR